MTPKQTLLSKLKAFHSEGFFDAVIDILRYYDQCNAMLPEEILEDEEYKAYAEDVRKMLLKDLEYYKPEIKF